MKEWYHWFFMTLCYVGVGIINYCSGRQIIYAVIAVSLTTALAFVQYFCDKRGEKGKRIFRYVCIGIIAILTVWLISLVITNGIL